MVFSVLLSSLFLTSVSFANPVIKESPSFGNFNNKVLSDGLADSNELFDKMKSSTLFLSVQKKLDYSIEMSRIIQQLNSLDELEQEKYESLLSVDGLTEENRIVLAKVMAFRYREAVQVSQQNLRNALLENIKVNNTEALRIFDNSGTNIRVASYYIQNKPVALKLCSDYLSILSNPWIENRWVVAESFRNNQFISYVKTGGPWDIKRSIGSNTYYNFLHNSKTGEYIGNHHYGYMGRHAGYSDNYLKIGAGLYQIVSGTSDWSFMSSYFDDPRDQEAITNGYGDYDVDFGSYMKP